MSNTDAMEVELKLRVPPAAYAGLARHPAIAGIARPQLHRLHAIYFDTAEQDLWRAGLALRVRRDGKTWTQTLKGQGRVDAGLHQRIELESQVAGPVPDLDAFAPGPWRERLAAAIAGKPLEAVCVTRFERSVRELQRAPGAVIEAALDRGRIEARGIQEPLCELELELKAGPPAALYELALELLQSVPLAAEPRSKAERGFALHAGKAHAPVYAHAIPLDAGMSCSVALAAIVSGALAHVQANEHGLQHGRDPEYVHQMRVGLRRLRSAFSLFRPALEAQHLAAVVAELRWVSQALGAARDWDVFMETHFAAVASAYPGHAGLEAYRRFFAGQQRLARQRARRAVASARYQRLVLGLGAWLHGAAWRRDDDAAAKMLLDKPIREFATEVLEMRYARMRKRGRRIERRSAEELHELRIAAKKVRYAAQFFGGLFDGGASDRLSSRLAHLQDALGALNDAAGARLLVESATPPGPVAAIAEARGLLLAWSAGQSALLQREAQRAWRAVRRSATFW